MRARLEGAVLLFTWNLNKNEEAFRLALAHLRSSGYSFIASFQELPPQVGTTVLAREVTKTLVGARVRCLGVTPSGRGSKHGRVGLFCSPNVGSTASDVWHDPRQRMAVVSVSGARVAPLLVIGYHGENRRDSPDRGRIGVQAREAIDKHWRADPLVMLGDFNANPFDAEVCGSEGIFALRDREDARKKWASPLVVLGETQRPVFNPMWSLLPERSKRPKGSLQHDHMQMLRWRLYDQILVSPDLLDQIREMPEILPEIAGRGLLTADGNPDESISDHLPVQLRVTI
jgi:endonuclease/exonuclease/phosphatase family metal-dependent hydrolase